MADTRTQDAGGAGTDPAAAAIYQSKVDTIDRHFWRREWDDCLPGFHMPCRMTGPGLDRTVADPEAFRDLLIAARENFAAAGATDYHRICRAARFLDDARTRITGWHESFVMRGGSLRLPRYVGQVEVALIDDRWRVTALHTEKREADLPLFSADAVPLNRS